MEHYKQLYIYEKYYMPDCPLFIEKYALTKDNVKNSIFAQIKLRNIGMKNILATYINVKCFDIENHELGEPIEYIYQDKVVARGAVPYWITSRPRRKRNRLQEIPTSLRSSE